MILGGFWAGLGLALDNIYRKFYRTLNNAKKPFNSIFNSIFLRIIHSKKLFLKNYSFKEKFIQKNWQLFIQKIIHLEKNGNYSFKKLFNYKKIIQQNIHSKNLKIIHSKKLFIFLKNWLSPRAIGKPSFSKSKALTGNNEETVFWEACMPIYIKLCFER